MTILEQLRIRVELAAKNLRNELLSTNDADAVLPVGDITVEITANGVIVQFVKEDKKPIVEEPKFASENPVVEKRASAKAGKSSK